MMLRPAALARATNSASTYLKQTSAMAGTFERNISAAAPAGEMSSVETLSPSLSSTGASSRSAIGSPGGNGLVLGAGPASPEASGGPEPEVGGAEGSGGLPRPSPAR